MTGVVLQACGGKNCLFEHMVGKRMPGFIFTRCTCALFVLKRHVVDAILCAWIFKMRALGAVVHTEAPLGVSNGHLLRGAGGVGRLRMVDFSF